MSALLPCRFCGETEHLQVHDAYHCDNDQFTWDSDLNIIRGPTGEPAYRDDDGIEWLVCNASAPRTMWQADDVTNRTMRLRTLEAWSEYDDDGEWQGPAPAVAA